MVDVPFWDDEPEVWDTLGLGGDTWPGVATLLPDRGRKVDEKAAKGKNSATLTDQGVENAKVDIVVGQIASKEEMLELIRLLAKIEPKGGKEKMVGLDVVHPMATIRGIRAVAILKIVGPELKGGIMSVKLEAKQFDPPPVLTGTGFAGKGATGTAQAGADVTSTPDGAIGPGAAGGAAAALATPDKTYTKK